MRHPKRCGIVAAQNMVDELTPKSQLESITHSLNVFIYHSDAGALQNAPVFGRNAFIFIREAAASAAAAWAGRRAV